MNFQINFWFYAAMFSMTAYILEACWIAYLIYLLNKKDKK